MSRLFRRYVPSFLFAVFMIAVALVYERWWGSEEVRLENGARVIILDGDTLRAGDTDYRIRGIDAPELQQTCLDEQKHEWPCGREARSHLRTLLGRGEIRCAWNARDRIGRVLATCSTGTVADVGEAMVRDGFAVDFGGFTSIYDKAEAEAKAARRGIWRGSFEPPQEWRNKHPRSDERK